MRHPYVGEGRDGCLRSAQIDLEEADGLDKSDPRYALLLLSAAEWQQQADAEPWPDEADQQRYTQREVDPLTLSAPYPTPRSRGSWRRHTTDRHSEAPRDDCWRCRRRR